MSAKCYSGQIFVHDNKILAKRGFFYNCFPVIRTVFAAGMFNRLISFRRSLRNFVRELGLITLSSGAISRKYLKDCTASIIKTIFINKLFINKSQSFQFFYLWEQVVFWND